MYNIETTNEYKALTELKTMDELAQVALSQFKMYTNEAYNKFWFGETEPSVKIALLGTNALNAFTQSAQAQAFIKSIEPDYVELGIPNGYIVNWGNDGSATITGEYLPINNEVI